MNEPIKNRYEFVLLFDVKDGNPNGDPDAGNMPRIDPETGHGLVTDVCLKRKVRNYVEITQSEKEKMKIFIKEKAILNEKTKEAREYVQKKSEQKMDESKIIKDARERMCEQYFDIRTFGAVMSTKENAGQVRGPVQFGFARSVDRITAAEHTITRMAVTTKEEAKKQEGDNRTMGSKFTIPYGLYRVHGFISAPLAKQTRFSEEDLQLFWEALKNMFDHDRSAARGEMAAQKLIVFKHDCELGSAPAQKLFGLVEVEKECGERPPRSFADYTVKDGDPPDGVEKQVLI